MQCNLSTIRVWANMYNKTTNITQEHKMYFTYLYKLNKSPVRERGEVKFMGGQIGSGKYGGDAKGSKEGRERVQCT